MQLRCMLLCSALSICVVLQAADEAAAERPWLGVSRGTDRNLSFVVSDSLRLHFTLRAREETRYELRFPGEVASTSRDSTRYTEVRYQTKWPSTPNDSARYEVARAHYRGYSSVDEKLDQMNTGHPGRDGSAFLPESSERGLLALEVGALRDSTGGIVYPFLRAGPSGVGYFIEWCRVAADSSFVMVVLADWMNPWRSTDGRDPLDPAPRVFTRSSPIRASASKKSGRSR